MLAIDRAPASTAAAATAGSRIGDGGEVGQQVGASVSWSSCLRFIIGITSRTRQTHRTPEPWTKGDVGMDQKPVPVPAATVVYTDGACSGNLGPGGWAWAVPRGRYASGARAQTTNQRMEIMAVLEAAKALDGPLEVVSDSTYVINCFRDRWWKAGSRKTGPTVRNGRSSIETCGSRSSRSCGNVASRSAG
jgi:hypothetical protein